MKHHYLFAGLALTTCASLMSLALAPYPAWAQSSGPVRGQVIDVDQSAGEITIRQLPIKKLGMDHGMTMVFRAKDPEMLKRVNAAATRGNQIRAADLLGVNRSTLRKKIRDLEIQVIRTSG